MKSKRLVIALAPGLGLILTLLLALSIVEGLALSVAEGQDSGSPARAAPAADLTVCPAGPLMDVGVGAGGHFDDVAGTYTDIHQRAGITQVVYISKTVTIRGGYTTTNWATSDPVANPTTLDARGLGRVLVISGTIAPTVEGLHITGGDATGLDGTPPGWTGDAGGGVYIYEAAATISDCVVHSNTASTASIDAWSLGGGLFLYRSAATLSGNTVQSNTASTANWGVGGGLFLYECDNATLSGNTVQGNIAGAASDGFGGGLYLSYSNATLSGNTVQGNTASTASGGFGGGLYLSYSNAILEGNAVEGNTASTVDRGQGGGLRLVYSAATLSGNTIVSNTATLSPTASGHGGGVWVFGCSPFTLTNNLLADNHANTEGSGLWFEGTSTDPTSGRLLHTTIADNRGSGQGVYVDEYTTLAFTNTIIAGHSSVGITVTAGSTATLEATLWYGNGSDTDGGGYIFTGTVNVYGDPAFVNPSAWDYHLAAGSAAIDKGVNAGVTTDIDGHLRPLGEGYDLGADEWEWPPRAIIYLPLTLRNNYP